ncbi:MAG: DUF3365 domain-containing protein [Candidatus Kapabacteria bacterium]|nr:DUF3365 domain-containing protein [Candidatus Kapabacteria bacterium]
MKKISFLIASFVWLAFILASYIYNRDLVITSNGQTVLEMSRSFFKVILNTRAWNARHGGVFTPVTATNQPNEYLIDSNRDVTTTTGIHLTKINPAYMTRQIFEMARSDSYIYFHITSLIPLRPLNEADEWEKSSLASFESGNKEIFERVKSDSGDYYRFMAPLKVEKPCLKCHAKQGYKEGMIRGGISVNSRSTRFDAILERDLVNNDLLHGVFLFLGLLGFWIFFKFSDKQFNTINTLLNQVYESKNIIEEKAANLDELNKTKDKLFSIIAHDLINPVGNFKQVIDLLSDEYEKMDNIERKEFIDSTKGSATQVYTLLQNLLTWSRSQRNIIQFTRNNQILSLFVKNCLSTLNAQATNKEIHLINNVEASIEVLADAFMLETILRNLISNAIKFSYRNGKVEIGATIENGFTKIFVKDEGTGMSNADKENLFRIDMKVSSVGTENEPSTGLGLVICKEFVEKHNGTIEIETEKGKGSSFIFTLSNE